ncbi:hypothetical protein Micbo1qcDRAFT_214323 [Microdochium bolleyi]|uniref:2EXR domain-containing protein n=1 Tax=Microdochium bolleyi TaxID=196109 RepID=A0A136ITY2_9PEZI|nr:hypothetical protein Micbo1qcDRAFT_214323 [Microdochium bolleyi]
MASTASDASDVGSPATESVADSAGDESQTFPLFARLPTELRHKIWRDALAGTAVKDKTGPIMWSIKPSCWQARPESDLDLGDNIMRTAPDPDDEEPEALVCAYWLHSANVLPYNALLYVNQEARELAADWQADVMAQVRDEAAREPMVGTEPEQDSAAVLDDSDPPVGLVRRYFDLVHDALYFPEGDWADDDGALRGLLDLLEQHDIYCNGSTTLTRVAMTRAALLANLARLSELSTWLPRIEQLLIVLNEPPSEKPGGGGGEPKPDEAARQFEFEHDEDEDVPDDEVHAFVESIAEDLGRIAEWTDFEIVPVIAIRAC